MQSGRKDIIRGPAGRALTACQFCRNKKMKCNAEKPRCRNCEAHDKDCVYIELGKQPRPSKARIARLEEEIRELQDTLSELKLKQQNHGPEEGDSTFPSNLQVLNVILGHKDSLLLRDIFSADKNPTYHGPTSAMFDDGADGRPARRGASRASKGQSTEWVKKGLLAESAQQRQLERVNLAAGKLDFDGVEPELAMHLLSLFWEREHHWAMIVYRTAFMRDMAGGGGPYFSKLLLNAIYHAASKFTSRTEVRHDPAECLTAGWRFRRRVMELMSQAFDHSAITTIQALLVLASSLFSWCDERSSAWLYAGIAIRMVVDLGLHVESPAAIQQLSDEDIEIRRRVFWGAFILDKLQSLYQGRPVSLRGADSKVPIVFLDEYEELESWTPKEDVQFVVHYDSTEPGYSMSWLAQFAKLSGIMDRILNSLYTEETSSKSDGILHQDLQGLHGALETWRATLPACFHIERLSSNGDLLPHVISLMCLYDATVILLHRPFVSSGHLQQSLPSSTATSSFSTCASAASDFIHWAHAYEREFSLQKAPFVISYAAYVCATIHVRIAAQNRPADSSSSRTALRTCLRVLDQNQTTYWAANRANRIVRGLMRRMGVDVEVDGLGVSAHTATSEASVSSEGPGTVIKTPTTDDGMGGLLTPSIGSYELPMDLDIDTIIQSFVADADYGFQPPRTSPCPLLAGDNNASTELVSSSAGGYGPTDILSPPSQAHGDGDPGALPGSLSMPDPTTISPGFYFSDPIFGFDSTALDEFDVDCPLFQRPDL